MRTIPMQLIPLFKNLNQLTKSVVTDFTTDARTQTELPILTFSDLQSFFSKTINNHVVHILPKTLDIASPLNTTPANGIPASIDCLKSLIGWHTQDKSTQIVGQPGMHLQRPLVMLFPIQSETTLPNTESPWISVVVLPKSYQAPFGAPTGNSQHQIIYMDSRVTSRAEEMPEPFKLFYKLITEGGAITNNQNQRLIISAAFPNAVFYNASHQQQLIHSDNLSFAVYNALMIVLTGNGEFAKSMQPSRVLSHQLRQVISVYLTPPLDKETAMTQLLEKLNQLKENCDFYSQIEENLRIGLLYTFITNERNKYPVTEDTTSDELKEILQQDENMRRKFYNSQNDLQSYLAPLDVIALQKLFELSANPTNLLQQLKTTRNTHYQNLIHWEIQIQKLIIARAENWLPYVEKKTKALGHFIYNHSLIGLGGEFTSLTSHVLAAQPSMQSAATYLKQILLQCIQYVVFYATASQEKAERAAASVADWLTEHNLLVLFKYAGILIGIYYTYFAGAVSLIRLLTMNLVALKASQHLSAGVVDDLNARVVNYALPFDPTYTFCFRVMIMMSALLETLYAKSAAPCVRALSALCGGIAMTKLGQYAIPELRITANQKPTAEQMLALFVFSNVGYALGDLISGTGLDALDNVRTKIQTRDAATAALRYRETKGELTDLNIRTPSLLVPSSLWFNAENPLEMSWRNPNDGRVYHTHCQVAPHDVVCDSVIGVATLNNGY